MKQQGFTLIELIVVLAILGLASAMIVPRISNNELALLKTEMREVVSVLNYSRRTAVIRGIPMEAAFHAVPKKQENAPATDKQPKKIDGWVSKGASIRWGGDMENKPDEENGAKIIMFYPEGSASGGELILQRGEFIAKISVNPITGKIKATLEE